MSEFVFEETPWEQFIQSLHDHDVYDISASQILTLLEGESEEAAEEALAHLDEDLAAWIHINLSDLPRPVITGETGIRLKREAELAGKQKLLENLEETDPLRLYLEEIASIPASGDICAVAEELALANLEGRSNERLRERVVELSLSRVVELAWEFTGWGVLLLDLIQEGSLGLWKSTEKLAGQGISYPGVRDWWIRLYMTRAVLLQARQNGVGQKMRQAMEDYRSVDERLISELGRNATLEEIAQELHMTLEEAETVRDTLDSARLLSQARAANSPKEEEPEEEQHVEDTALFQARQRIADLLSGLTEADARLLTLRFGLEGGLPLSPEETGRRLGLTPEEVIAREAAALAQLRS